MLAQVEELSAQAQGLARTADELQYLVSRFQIDDPESEKAFTDAEDAHTEALPALSPSAGDREVSGPKHLRRAS